MITLQEDNSHGGVKKGEHHKSFWDLHDHGEIGQTLKASTRHLRHSFSTDQGPSPIDDMDDEEAEEEAQERAKIIERGGKRRFAVAPGLREEDRRGESIWIRCEEPTGPVFSSFFCDFQ